MFAWWEMRVKKVGQLITNGSREYKERVEVIVSEGRRTNCIIGNEAYTTDLSTVLC